MGRGPRGRVLRSTQRVSAARSLIRTGPSAAAAVERLLGLDDPYLRIDVLDGFQGTEAEWAIPILVDFARRADLGEAMSAIEAIEGQTKKELLPPFRPMSSGFDEARRRRIGRDRMIDWWEREGRAKYGGCL